MLLLHLCLQSYTLRWKWLQKLKVSVSRWIWGVSRSANCRTRGKEGGWRWVSCSVFIAILTQTKILSSGIQDSKSCLVLVLIFTVPRSPSGCFCRPSPTPPSCFHLSCQPTSSSLLPPPLSSCLRFSHLPSVLNPFQHPCLLQCSRLCLFSSPFHSQSVPKNPSFLWSSQPIRAQGHACAQVVRCGAAVLSGCSAKCQHLQ